LPCLIEIFKMAAAPKAFEGMEHSKAVLPLAEKGKGPKPMSIADESACRECPKLKKGVMIEKIKHLAAQLQPEIKGYRRHLHQYPELSFQEYETSKYIAAQLEKCGIKHQTGMAGTGICAWIEGKNPNAALLALRADMDALPISEANEVDYKSKNEGVMHACGHDVHTSSLLGVAKILNSLKNDWNGRVQLIFQPGEELLPGGASKVLAEGWLDHPKPAAIIGQHVEPGMEVGKIGMKAGQFMASADEIYVTVKGKGGHAARPHQCIDTTLLAAHLVVALQQIVSRRSDPLLPSVLSFGKIFSDGGATNIIPNQVSIYGTFRTFDESWRTEAHQLMKQMARDLCKSMGGDCDFDIRVGYPFVYNDEALTHRLKTTATAYLGAENVLDIPARMGGEDFAFYSQQMPASFYRLGTKNPNGTGLHSNTFDIDEAALETSIGLMSQLAIEELNFQMKNT
jgi:amidohydrolase